MEDGSYFKIYSTFSFIQAPLSGELLGRGKAILFGLDFLYKGCFLWCLTRVKTELYFRQVLGRILRGSGEEGEEGFFYMPAEPKLIEYAHRVADDIPRSNIVALENMQTQEISMQPADTWTRDVHQDPILMLAALSTESPIPTNIFPDQPSMLAQSYESTINIFGRFKQEIIAL